MAVVTVKVFGLAGLRRSLASDATRADIGIATASRRSRRGIV